VWRGGRGDGEVEREGLKESEGMENGEKGGWERERDMDPDVPHRSTPLNATKLQKVNDKLRGLRS
jgi:hypothetical protein